MFIPGKKSIDFENAPAEERNYDKFGYCTIPDNRLHVHLKRLLHRGLKVGIVDQIDPLSLKSSKLFKRQFSHVYTLSTYIEDTIADELNKRSGNFIVSLKETESKITIVAVNIYSGEVIYDEFEDDFTRNQLDTRLDHLDPIEFLLIGELSKDTERSISNFTKLNTSSGCVIRSEKREPKLLAFVN
ncbi:unnamed protein product [Ambrosiozyma monospora]|uniref:Unnamed protein product n=1 Tax=Ambrosiozyma monospora TaxID=43982 RepID=A0ACB5U593_AMBMO|nr:unnamed protein product [Ambrosiozyma monospora]